MEVLKLIDYMEEELTKASTVPLTGKRLVDVEKCLDMLYDLRAELPAEVKKASIIVRDHDAIIEDANKEAEMIQQEAEQQFEQLVSEHNITQEAMRRADEIVKRAMAQADQARRECDHYIVELLGEVEHHLDQVLGDIHQNRMDILKPQQR